MLPITRTARARRAALCQHMPPAISHPKYTSRASNRRLHTKPPNYSSLEAAPAAVQVRHESGRGMRAIDDIMARRARAGKLVAGIAAASDSDMFKGSVSV